MADKASKPKAKAKKSIADKKSSKADVSKQLEELNESLNQEKEKYLRLFAEFENFKKRTAKERIELFKTANQEVISALIPVLDDFNRANQQMEKEKGALDQKGIQLIYTKFSEVLKSNGLTQTEEKIGDSFDAELHEAIT